MPPHAESSPQVYRDLVDVAPDAMIAVDADTGEIRLANARAECVFGHAREDLVGRPVDLLVPPRLRGARLRRLAGTTPPPDPWSSGAAGSELVALHRDGHEFPVDVWLTPIPGHDRPLVGVAIRDVSGRRAVQQAVEQMRDELIATVSHELRTPLTSILGYTELLADMEEDALGEHAARLLDVVHRNAQRELKLVEDMLALACLGTSTLMVDAEPTDLGEITRGVLTDLGRQARQSGVEVVLTGSESLWVVGDSDGLVQVLANLVSNAIKFTAPGGAIEVRLLVDGSHGVVEVEDQGIGVPAEELPRVFERLYRAPEAVAAQVPGAGLGLPVVKGIIDAHEGDVDVESLPGEGTKVRVRLPLAAAELAG